MSKASLGKKPTSNYQHQLSQRNDPLNKACGGRKPEPVWAWVVKPAPNDERSILKRAWFDSEGTPSYNQHLYIENLSCKFGKRITSGDAKIRAVIVREWEPEGLKEEAARRVRPDERPCLAETAGHAWFESQDCKYPKVAAEEIPRVGIRSVKEVPQPAEWALKGIWHGTNKITRNCWLRF